MPPDPHAPSSDAGSPSPRHGQDDSGPPGHLCIGWREWLSLPDLDVPGIKAKVDTGARSSALHTHDYEVYDEAGAPWVQFHLHPLVSSTRVELTCRAAVSEFRDVKDSGGHIERRPFITTRARIGPLEWTIHLSLTNREGMKFRMLLGRAALSGRFVIDPTSSYLVGKSLARHYRPDNPA